MATKTVITGLVGAGGSQALSAKTVPAIQKIQEALATMRAGAPAPIRSDVDQVDTVWSPLLAELLARAKHPGSKPPASFEHEGNKAVKVFLRAPGAAIGAWADAHCPGYVAPGSGTSGAATGSGSTAGGAPVGLVAFLDRRGIEVADPLGGAVRLVVPIPSPVLGNSTTGRYLVDGPVWGAAPGVTHPVLYFVLHQVGAAAAIDDVFVRADPFTGTLSVIAAVPDDTGSTSGLAAIPGELLYSSGCCEDFSIAALPLGTSGTPQPSVVESATNGMWFSLGATSRGRLAAALGVIGQARRYLWVDPTNGSTAPLSVPSYLSSSLSTSIVTLAVNANGTLEALSVNNLSGAGGGALEVLNIATGALSTPDSLLGLPSGLAFAPSEPWLAVASGGSVSVLDASARNGAGAGRTTTAQPTNPYRLSTAATGAQSVSWSAPITSLGFEDVKAAHQGVDQLVHQAQATSAPTPPPAMSPPGRCRTSEFTVKAYRVAGGGAAGSRGGAFGLVNHGAVSCTLSGYPGMQLLGANGKALPTTVIRGQYEVGRSRSYSNGMKRGLPR